MVRDLVLGFIPDDWLHGLDYSTLEKVPASYVADDLRKRSDDVVWRVPSELKRTFALWIRALLFRRSRHTLVLPQVRDLVELEMTLAEKFDRWAGQYKREGRQE